MSDRSIRDGPRTTRQEYQAERDADARREIIETFKDMDIWEDMKPDEREEHVAEALREMRTPHTSLTAEERQR